MLFNKRRALDYMRCCGLDVLVATSPVNVTYFSDYYFWLDPLMKEFMVRPGGSTNRAVETLAVFFQTGDAVLVVSSGLVVNATDLWVRDLSAVGDPGFDCSCGDRVVQGTEKRILDVLAPHRRSATVADALFEILNSRGRIDAHIGLEMEGLALRTKDEIARLLPRAMLSDCTNLIRLIRMVKSSEELRRLTLAAEISETAMIESLAPARSATAIADIIQRYRARVAEAGAAFDHVIFGLYGLGTASEPDYVLGEEDVISVDFGCVYRSYFSDSGLTIALRKQPAELLKRYAILRACIDTGADACRLGVRASAVYDAMQAVLSAHGVVPSNPPPHGHGMGLELRDYPIIVPDTGLRISDDCVDVDADLPLEEGMVINLEAPLCLPGRGWLHLEMTFVVEENSARPLVAQDRAQPWLLSGRWTPTAAEFA